MNHALGHFADDDALEVGIRFESAGTSSLRFVAAVFRGAELLVLTGAAGEAVTGTISLGHAVIILGATLTAASLGIFHDGHWYLGEALAALRQVEGLESAAGKVGGVIGGTKSAAGLPARSIRFEGVGFRYPGRDRPVFASLELEIEAGRSLAIVGENGAGKTTLVNLLCGFYEPTRGRILVDGVDLAEIDKRAWQRRIAAVFQDFAKYPLTLRENIVLGHPGRAADYETRVRAGKRAGIMEMVDALPQNWNTILSKKFEDGTDLSGGQWQRVALARAMFALECGAGVLVLDEPTANLDVRAESALYERFLDLTAGLTTIVVSHRFSTVRRADRIVVLEGGRIVESGSHDQLMALDGRYARMFDLQARYYADGESEYSEYAETGSAETGNAETGYAAMAYDDEGAEFEADFS